MLPLKLRRAFFAQLARSSVVHDSVTTIRLFVHFVDVHQVPTTAATFPVRPHPAVPDYHVIRRLLKLRDQPGWLASDELDWILEYPRMVLPQTYFCPPARWCPVTFAFDYFQGLAPDFRHHTSVTWFVIVDGTWVQLDLSVGDAWATVGATGLKTLFCYGPPEVFGYIPRFIEHIANLIGLPASEIQAVPVPFHTPPGMCGWSLIYGFFQRMRLTFPDTPHAFLDILAASKHRELVNSIKQTDFLFWENSGVDTGTVDFAYDCRNGFLCRILEGRTTESFASAGGPGDEAKATGAEANVTPQPKANVAVDPWTTSDPWTKKPKRLFSTKWEDLLLPERHPILDDKGNRLDQTHKLQMCSRKAGAVLATKPSIPDLMRAAPTAPAVVVLPNAEKSSFGDLSSKLLGPFELVLCDAALNTEYKRLVLLLPLFGAISYSLPKPSVTLTATEVTEVVAELDSRLLSPQDIDNVKANPMDFIRHLVLQQHESLKDVLAFYALRVGKHPTAAKHDTQWQCIIKTPAKHRAALLQTSGLHLVLLRDYIDRQHVREDLTVVPRFWPPTAKDLNELQIIIRNTPGFAGIALTRRGLAVRAWNPNIAAIRKAVLPTDPRLTPENLSVVPRFSFQSSGWPPAIEPCSIVASTKQATGLAPVPTRAFRFGGVYGWNLAFDAKPKIDRFTLDINGSTFEILLVEECMLPPPKPQRNQQKKDKMPPPGGNTAAAVSKSAPFVPQPPFSGESQRIAKLEEKFDLMEQRQSRIEHKVDARFEEISSSLRQLLHASTSRSRESTGDTPAAKQPRFDGSL